MGVLVGIILEFLAKIFSKVFLHASFKIAITVAFIGMFVTAIYAYVQTYKTIVNGIGQTVPDIVAGVWGWVMPSNINLLIFSILSVYMLRFTTRLFLKILQFKFKASISN